MTGSSTVPGLAAARPGFLDERRTELKELAPLLRRAISLDHHAMTRLRATPDTVSALVRLPFAVVVGLSVATIHTGSTSAASTSSASISAVPASSVPISSVPVSSAPVAGGHGLDQCTVGVAALLEWLDDRAAPLPVADEQAWRGGVPPASRWHVVDTVPAAVVRDLVAQAGQVLNEAIAREGVPGARPRPGVTDALLDSVVLTVIADEPAALAPNQVALTLRPLGAMVRMGLVPRTGHLRVDISGRWVRLASPLGSAYAERPGLGLTLLS